MCGRLLRLWHASYGYGGRVAGRDEGNGAVDVDRYTLVVRRGGCPRARGIDEAYNFRQCRSEAIAEKHCLGLRVGGGAACAEGCCVCGMPRTGMGVESPAGMREMGRLMLIGILWWCDVGDVHGHGALAKRAVDARGPVDEAWLGCPAMSVSSGGVGGSRLSDVGVSCRTSRRRRGWFRLENSRR